MGLTFLFDLDERYYIAKSSLKPLQNPIFGTFLRDALLGRLKIFQYYLRVLRCYHFELRSNLGLYKGLNLQFIRYTLFATIWLIHK
ncbi:hypothetical protein [Kingella kingae]|uniref:hypothetical protein n=1 Tax=Kingella kingae TaxID=504 RepID=UPI002552ECB3|nr:hypothetical protein [Kingella kingae]